MRAPLGGQNDGIIYSRAGKSRKISPLVISLDVIKPEALFCAIVPPLRPRLHGPGVSLSTFVCRGRAQHVASSRSGALQTRDLSAFGVRDGAGSTLHQTQSRPQERRRSDAGVGAP